MHWRRPPIAAVECWAVVWLRLKPRLLGMPERENSSRPPVPYWPVHCLPLLLPLPTLPARCSHCSCPTTLLTWVWCEDITFTTHSSQAGPVCFYYTGAVVFQLRLLYFVSSPKIVTLKQVSSTINVQETPCDKINDSTSVDLFSFTDRCDA